MVAMLIDLLLLELDVCVLLRDRLDVCLVQFLERGVQACDLLLQELDVCVLLRVLLDVLLVISDTLYADKIDYFFLLISNWSHASG